MHALDASDLSEANSGVRDSNKIARRVHDPAGSGRVMQSVMDGCGLGYRLSGTA